jgi:hypothetical protein
MTLAVFAAVFTGALLGMWLRRQLPDHHLNADSKDIVKLSMGLLATMAALVLGLLIASANGSYDGRRHEFQRMAASIVVLDRVLSEYGPGADNVREQLRHDVAHVIRVIWPSDGAGAELDPAVTRSEGLYKHLQALHPADDAQRSLKAEALSLAREISQMRWLMFEEAGLSIPMPFLVVLIVWLSLLFTSFGLFGPSNWTVVTALGIAGVAVASAIFIILELADPSAGVIKLSSAPLVRALAHLRQ